MVSLNGMRIQCTIMDVVQTKIRLLLEGQFDQGLNVQFCEAFLCGKIP